jgi:hypothetical protein
MHQLDFRRLMTSALIAFKTRLWGFLSTIDYFVYCGFLFSSIWPKP